MKIGIISDTHDNLKNIKKVIEKLNKEKVKYVFHCGDIISPFALKEFEKLNCKMYLVFGNNDGDKYLLIKNKPENVEILGYFGEVEINGYEIFITHYDFVGLAFCFLNKYDFVFCGHSHKPEIKKLGKTTLINPGNVAGYLNKANYAILNLKNKKVKIKNL